MSSAKTKPLYEADYCAWINRQVELLRAGKTAELDLVNLIDEIESLARSERRLLKSHLSILLAHLLKWRHLPGAPSSRRIRYLIEEQRDEVRIILDENPSLQPELATKFIARAYRSAINLTVAETPLDYEAFEQDCPWSEAQILDDNYWPGQ